MNSLNNTLCSALMDMRQNELPKVREKINKILQTIVDEERQKSNFIFDSISSRIKSIESFKEKIPRKDYGKRWKLNSKATKAACIKAIRENLEDLIGFRINCYFKNDEYKALKIIKDHLSVVKDIKRPDVDKSGAKNNGVYKGKNGQTIYKIVYSIKYNKCDYFFELQVKCLAHNLWGEVEHEVSYKAKQYDYDMSSKKTLLNENLHILEASDSQLQQFLSKEYTEMDLINTLFFYYTKDEVQNKLNGENPTSYYVQFFKLTADKTDLIKNYVKQRISVTKTITPSKFKKTKKADSTESYFVNNILSAYYDPLLWEKEQKISSILFNFNVDDFLWFMSDCLLSPERKKIVDANKKLDQDNNIDLDDIDQDNDIDLDDVNQKNITPQREPSREDRIRGTINDLRATDINKPILLAAFNSFCSIFIKEV